MRRELRAWYRDNKPSGLLTLAVYRFGNTVYYRCKIPVLRQVLLVLYALLDNVIVKLLCGAEFPARCRIGRHLRLPHGANGIILHGGAVIGDDVTLFHQVTLGMKDAEEPDSAPSIGSGVVVGAGAKILGRVTVGDHSSVGANAVVIRDVPGYSTAVGVPAQIKRKDARRVIGLARKTPWRSERSGPVTPVAAQQSTGSKQE
jgi:serine O-acetyltransferase